jgi:WXG100 family type VII secretion target
MSQAIVDPDELRRFAHNLDRFNRELQNQMQVLRGQLKNLGQTWRDQEHDKFIQQFDETMLVMNRFVDISTEQIPMLLRKAERVEEYLKQR